VADLDILFLPAEPQRFPELCVTDQTIVVDGGGTIAG
jgi:hypothetical protein